MVALIEPVVTGIIELPAYEVWVKTQDFSDRIGHIIIADSEEEAREKFRIRMKKEGKVESLQELERGNISFRKCEATA